MGSGVLLLVESWRRRMANGLGEAIGRYKLEKLNDYNPVYDEDLSFCDKIMKDIVYQYVYDSDVYQRMMASREVAQVQESECKELGDIVEEQNCQIMQGM